MEQVRIGLIGHRGDAQLSRLIDELARRQAVPVPFDLTDLPAYVACHWEGESLRFGELDLASLHAVYGRTALFPQPTFAPGVPAEQAERVTFPVRESGALMNALVAELERRMPVVNPTASLRYHGMKPFMYRALRQAGVPVPEFAVGSDLAAAARFVHRLGEQVVVKPLMGGEVLLADLAYLAAHHREVDRRPLLLQRRILGRSLRAYVVAGQVVAAAWMIHGPAVDWRSDLEEIRPVELQAAAARACCCSATALGLLFAAVDLEEEGGAGGAPWVIDVNPGPMFAGFEIRSGLDVAGPLAGLLVALARGEREQGVLGPDRAEHTSHHKVAEDGEGAAGAGP